MVNDVLIKLKISRDNLKFMFESYQSIARNYDKNGREDQGRIWHEKAWEVQESFNTINEEIERIEKEVIKNGTDV